MTDVPRTNLLEFIGFEQTNLLVTMVKFHADIAQGFPMLDGAYQAPLEHIDVKIEDVHKQTIMALYLFAHYHLYFSTVCLLRCHLSDSLGSTRKAIDATLTAYRLIEEPVTLEQYSARSWEALPQGSTLRHGMPSSKNWKKHLRRWPTRLTRKSTLEKQLQRHRHRKKTMAG